MPPTRYEMMNWRTEIQDGMVVLTTVVLREAHREGQRPRYQVICRNPDGHYDVRIWTAPEDEHNVTT
jgi:hypothetical protein